MMKLYKVGGCVRDEILGIKSKDVDYSVEAESFEAMRTDLLARGMKIYPTPEEYMTVRGKLNGVDADFVLCRKDGFYSDGRRPDTVEMGTIMDDLARRDFTMNAIAIDEDTKEILDPFNGRKDIADKIIRCVGSTDRLKEDSLRMIRALRFSITKGFRMSDDVIDCIENNWNLLENVSRERIAVELNLMLANSTRDTFRLMVDFQDMFEFIFDECKVDLKAILKEK